MTAARRETREKARELRKQGLSIREITLELGVSKGSVSEWVRDIELTEDQIKALKSKQSLWANQNAGGQANRRNALAQRAGYQAVGRERAKQGSKLHMMGCMLYWAEGAKQRNAIVFVNSDPSMMLLFMRFLREELGVISSTLAMYIHCHTHDIDEHERIKRYWLDLLQLPDECFNKILIKKGSETRIRRIENGLCTIRVYSTELTMHIYGAIQEYGGFDNPEWLF